MIRCKDTIRVVCEVWAGWNAGEFDKKSLGNNKYVLDPDAAYEYVITCAPSRLNIRVRVRVS